MNSTRDNPDGGVKRKGGEQDERNRWGRRGRSEEEEEEGVGGEEAVALYY